jgi:hypothetical protein
MTGAGGPPPSRLSALDNLGPQRAISLPFDLWMPPRPVEFSASSFLFLCYLLLCIARRCEYPWMPASFLNSHHHCIPRDD